MTVLSIIEESCVIHLQIMMLTAYMTVFIPQSCWNSWSKQPSTKARLTGCVFTIKIKHCIISEKIQHILTPMLWKLTIWYNVMSNSAELLSYLSTRIVTRTILIFLNLITNFIMSNSFKIQFKTRGGRSRHKLEFVLSVFGVAVF